MAYTDKPDSPQIESIDLRNIDKSVVNWFDRDFPTVINGKKVPTLYATAERWARVQKQKGYRDEKGTLILPLISIRRTTPDPLRERYVAEGEETNITLVKRIATVPTGDEKQPSAQDNKVADGVFTKTADSPIYEVLQIPFPSFVNVDYEVVVWTSYLSHQNKLDETIFKEFRGGRQYFYVNNYYFFGTLKGTTDQSNFEEFTEKERVIKYSFKLSLHAYFIDKDKVKVYRTPGNVKVGFRETSIPYKKLI